MNSSILVLLLTLSATVVVSSKYLKEHQKRQYGSEMPPGAACQNGLMGCGFSLIQNYQLNGNPHNAAALIAAAGARAVCKDVISMKSCAVRQLNSASCQVVPQKIRGIVLEALGLSDYLCVERLDDLEKHWKCLITPVPSVEMNMQQCVFTPRSNRCDLVPVVDCMVDAVVDSPECNEEAGELIRETLVRIVPIISAQCTAESDMAGYGGKIYAEQVVNVLLEQIWKRK